MPYQITSLELSEPLDALSIGPADSGLALILRYHDRPIGFIMRSLEPNTTLSTEQLSEWITPAVGEQLLKEKISAQLQPELQPVKFPSLSIAICTRDRPESLQRCLLALLPLQIPHNPVFEIVVVDNAPSDQRTYELVKTFPSVRYTAEPKPGISFARNHALQMATGELLAFLDDDTVVDPQWLKGLQTAFFENPDAGGFTGLVLPYELESEAQILFENRGGFRRGFEKIRYGQQLLGNPLYPCGAGIFGAGCNMAFRRLLLLELGGFDNVLGTGRPTQGGEDLDIFYRVIRAGYPFVYEPSYVIYHQHRREMLKLRRQYQGWGTGLMAFLTKSYQSDPPMRSRFVKLVAWWFRYQLRMLASSLKGNARSLPAGMILAEIWGGVTGLLGVYGRSRRQMAAIQQR